MPKLFGAWIDKTLPTCVFTSIQIRAFSVEELIACPWYLECKRSYAPAEEQMEKAAASKSIVEELSDDEVDQEIEEPPTDGKTKKKPLSKPQPATKKARKGKESGATSVREGEVAGAKVVLVASS
jgi:hypothetical protein